jgi:hypothetical protein
MLKILIIVVLIGLGLFGATFLALAQFWAWLTSSDDDEHRAHHVRTLKSPPNKHRGGLS